MSQLNTSDFRKGSKVILDAEPYDMLEVNFVKPGKGQALYKCRMKNLIKGTILDRTYKSGDSLEAADIRTGEAQFLYKDPMGLVFMDQDSFDQFTIPNDVAGDQARFLQDNAVCVVLFWGEVPIGMTAPSQAVMKVTYTESVSRGNTATNLTKPATVENGETVQVQQSELLRQQELFTTHAESLESRRIRLERLRTELEDTHRSTLEMRLAVEEAWVELTQVAGQEAARERVEQVRNTLVGYYRQLHEGVVEQRREHLESQTKFERLRAEFHDERQKLMEWISTRDQELKIGEERLRLSATDAAMRDSAWQAARDRWMQEKAEAEQVIRKLLAELGNQHRDPLLTLSQLSSLGMTTPSVPTTELITTQQTETID